MREYRLCVTEEQLQAIIDCIMALRMFEKHVIGFFGDDNQDDTGEWFFRSVLTMRKTLQDLKRLKLIASMKCEEITDGVTLKEPGQFEEVIKYYEQQLEEF